MHSRVKRLTKQAIARYIDHTILGPTVTQKNVKKVCNEAKRFDFCSVCVNPIHTKFVKQQLAKTNVRVCTVIGFPLGATTAREKAEDTKIAVIDGADEIDMVMNIGAMMEHNYHLIKKEITAVVRAARGRVVKVILETAYLTHEQIAHGCKIAKQAGAHFVKTSTGFAPGGATLAHVRLMRKCVGKSMGVKASGGIRTLRKCRAMIRAGANRIGASSLVNEFYGQATKSQEGY